MKWFKKRRRASAKAPAARGPAIATGSSDSGDTEARLEHESQQSTQLTEDLRAWRAGTRPPLPPSPSRRRSVAMRCGVCSGPAASARSIWATMASSIGPSPSRCYTAGPDTGQTPNGRGRRRGGSRNCTTPASWPCTTSACTRALSISSPTTSRGPTSAAGCRTIGRRGRTRRGSPSRCSMRWAMRTRGASSTATSNPRTSFSLPGARRCWWTSASR